MARNTVIGIRSPLVRATGANSRSGNHDQLRERPEPGALRIFRPHEIPGSRPRVLLRRSDPSESSDRASGTGDLRRSPARIARRARTISSATRHSHDRYEDIKRR